jgi:hypothetical protein
MCGFITSSGSTYYVDTQNQLIQGGKLKSPTYYTHCENTLIGCNPLFYLGSGDVLRTSKIVRYI